jgi:hypothetical protein
VYRRLEQAKAGDTVDVRGLKRSWGQVHKLVQRHPDAWKWPDLEAPFPLRIFAGAKAPRRVLVTTSEPALRRWPEAEWPTGLAVVVAVGNLSRTQASVIERLAADKSVPIAFLGDADPYCLHTYLSLKVHLGARRVRYCGLSDEVLAELHDEAVEPERLATWGHTELERAHLRIVEKCLKPSKTLGPRVAAVLASGRTIGIAHLSFRPGMISALFGAALRLACGSKRRLPSR